MNTTIKRWRKPQPKLGMAFRESYACSVVSGSEPPCSELKGGLLWICFLLGIRTGTGLALVEVLTEMHFCLTASSHLATVTLG